MYWFLYYKSHCCLYVLKKVTINKDFKGTEKIIKQKGSKIVLAGSGMLTGGRALEYLKHYITDSCQTILLVGYQAESTRGRALQNRIHEIKINGKYYTIHAHVEVVDSLSAHADQQELMQ